MVEYNLKAIDPRELGIDQSDESTSFLNQHAIPLVLRDKRGRIRWALPGNTYEENEQLGIRNVQALILEAFPEFDTMFPREGGKIPTDKEEDAKTFIKQSIGLYRKCVEVFGTSPSHKQTAPYFEGTFSTVIEKSFAPWGIKFSSRQILHLHPDYEQLSDGGTWVLRRYFNRLYSIAYQTLSKYLSCAQTKEGKDSRGGTRTFYHREEIERQLVEDGYLRRSNLPRVDNKTKRYSSPEGKSFVAARDLRSKFKVSGKTLGKYIEGVDSINGLSKKGTETILLNEEEANKALEGVLSLRTLPQADAKTRTYIDENGERWQIERYFCKHHQLKSDTLKKAAEQGKIRWISGRDAGGRPCRLYNLEDIETQNLVLPRTDQKNDEYVDSNGLCRVSRNFFHRTYGIHYRILDKILASCISVRGRTHGGVSNLYKKDEVIELLRKEDYIEDSKEGGIRKKCRRRERLSSRLHTENDTLLQEYTDLLHAGQIMSYAEFKRRRGSPK